MDGRSARWTGHRARRRRQLVESALRAVRRHGPAVGMDEIAAEAKTSKTVLYRHFGDRSGVYSAVVEAVDELVLADLELAGSGAEGDPGAQIEAMVRSYLTLIQRDPDIYRFVMARPASVAEQDSLGRISGRVAARLAELLLPITADAARAQAWGHGIVGLVQATAGAAIDTARPTTLDVVRVTDDVMALLRPALPASLTQENR